ncbi:hypothetical protein [Gordonia sihwensis]|uniref:hypothetical protein n=1 Tax=Gordonia sihwensis TaxID=173559 RepID=UPI003D984759
MADESGRASRASMDHHGHQSTGTRGDAKSRRSISTEAQRKTAGTAATAFYAAKNPSINPEMTHLNIDMVNDGDGSFRATASIEEVGRYGDERVARCRGLADGHRTMVTSVYHMPWAYLEPDGTEYQAVSKNGLPKVWKAGPSKGEPLMLPRYRIKPERRAEAMRYMDDVLEFHADLLPDGSRAVHGYSIQLDESRPHIQILSDCFGAAPTAKQPDGMRNRYSQAFGSDKTDRLVEQLDERGVVVLQSDGTPKMVREGASRKMERYHEEFKAFMLDRGHDVEAERDAVRHARRVNNDDYKELAQDQMELAAQAEMVGEAEADLGLIAAGLVEERRAVHEEAQTLEVDIFGDIASEAQEHEREVEKDLEAQRAEVAQLRKQARSEGYEKGLAAGTTRAVTEFEEIDAPKMRASAREEGKAAGEADAAKARQEAREAAERARADEQAARIAREEAERRLAELPEYDPQVAVQEMQAIRHDAAERVLVVAIEKGAYRTDPTTGKAVIEPASAVIDRKAAALWDQRRAGKKGPMPTETVGQRAEKVRGIAREGKQDLVKANATAERSRSQSNDGVGR